MASVSVCAQAIKLSHAIELLETQTLKGFNTYLKKLFKEAENKRKEDLKQIEKLRESIENLSENTSEKTEKPVSEFQKETQEELENRIKKEIEDDLRNR